MQQICVMYYICLTVGSPYPQLIVLRFNQLHMMQTKFTVKNTLI